MNYKTYAEAKIANPDCEIVTTGKNWEFEKSLKGVFQALGDSDGLRHSIGDDAWVICQPTDYCSTLKEFLEAGLNLVDGDMFIGANCTVITVVADCQSSRVNALDSNRYILSAAALNGGCKISANSEQWTVYNNTMPLCELTDEQAAMLLNAWRSGSNMQILNDDEEWNDYNGGFFALDIYRIKHKSGRELFIDKSVGLMTSETERTMEQMFGAQFDAGARYTDLTQYFGENI